MKMDYLTEKTENNYLFHFLLALLFGGLTGTLLCLLRFRTQNDFLPTLRDLSLTVSSRELRQIVMTDILFSLLVLFVSFFFQGNAVRSTLFFLKGFCCCYLCTLFVISYQTRGFLLAASLLLLHSFLLLPLQLTTAVTLAASSDGTQVRSKQIQLAAINAAAILICIFLEQYSVPLLLSRF